MHRLLSIVLPFVIVPMVLCSQAFAQSQVIDEITVRGEKESPLEETLTIREVRESCARDIGEALMQTEGLSFVRKGAYANDVVLRGLQRDNISVLMDGMRIYGACPNRMDPPASHYDFAAIEEIRIIKGPYDVENAGSLGGVIEAITKKTAKGLHAEPSLTYGSFNMINASVTASYGTEKYDGLMGYAYKYSDVPKDGNGKRLTEVYPPTSNNRYRPDAIDSRAYEIHTPWVKLGYNPTDTSRMELNYSYQDADHVLYPYLLMDADFDRTHLLNFTYKIEKISPLLTELRLQAYWDKVDHVMNDVNRETSDPANTGLPYRAALTRPYFMQTDAESETAGARASASLQVGKGTARFGVDYYNRNWDAVNTMLKRPPGSSSFTYLDEPMIPDVDVDNLGVFGSYQHPFGDEVTLKAGLRGDFTWAEANALSAARVASLLQPYYKGESLDTSTDFQEISGNIQVIYEPVKGLEVVAGLGRGIRTPDPQELYIGLTRGGSNWIGNPNLKPTTNHQADLGVKYSTDRYYVHLTLFYGKLDDYINVIDLPDPDGSGPLIVARSYVNVDATMTGFEFGSQISLPWNLYLKGSASYTRAENDTNDRPLSEIPPLKGVISLRYDVDTWFVEVAETIAASQNRVDTSLKETPTNNWTTTDIKVGYRYKNFTLYAGVNNLFDKFYSTHLSYLRDPFTAFDVINRVPEPGRNFYVTAMYRF